MLPKLRDLIGHYSEGATEGAVHGMFKYSNTAEILAAVSEYRIELQDKQLSLMKLQEYLKGYEYIDNIIKEGRL